MTRPRRRRNIARRHALLSTKQRPNANTKRRSASRNDLAANPTGNVSDACDGCNKIVLSLTGKADSKCYGTFGVFRDLAYDPCPRHSRFIQDVFSSRAWDEADLRWFTYNKGPAQVSFLEGNLITHSALQPSNVPHVKLMNQKWIDLRAIKEWKRTCITSHQSCNDWSMAERLRDMRPRLLVDTWRECLVPAPSDADYVALSYVWGDTQSFILEDAMLKHLEKPRALSSDSAFIRIPKTIRHALAMTAIVGERYLWVDALCVVQDNIDTKHSEISRMSGIYANATLTIIAAAGPDVDYGIPGIPGVSDPRHADQEVYDLGGRHQFLRTPWVSAPNAGGDKEFDCSFDVWKSRGWTYQEEAFSRRKLLFYGTGAAWVCRETDRAEFYDSTSACRLLLGPSYFSGPQAAGIDLGSSIPILEDLAVSIMQINDRKLTYPEDALYAFAGLMSVFSRQYEGGFVSGLPSLFFNFALLWQSESVQRREPLAKAYRRPCLPSWSWAGWQGRIRFWTWQELSKHQRIDSALRYDIYSRQVVLAHDWKDTLNTTIQWYSHEHRDQPGRPIVDKWSQYLTWYLDDLDRPAPRGWQRRSIQAYLNQYEHCDSCNREDLRYWTRRKTRSLSTSCSHYYSKACIDGTLPRCCYIHDSNPDQQFLFPLPAPADSELQSIIEARFISCKTRRAVLFGGDSFRKEPFMVSIRDHNAEWVGALNVHRDELTTNSLEGSKLELVEVAFSQVSYDSNLAGRVFVEWAHEECPKTGSQHKFYYVFWIQWQDGVAYREGLGRVLKSAWEAQPKEEIDLMLG